MRERENKISTTKLKMHTQNQVRFYDSRIIDENIQMVEILFNPLKYC